MVCNRVITNALELVKIVSGGIRFNKTDFGMCSDAYNERK
jgi:hypothetical protein